MSSFGGILSIARSALHVHQLAVQVAAQNISNAETPGYSRHRLDLSAEWPEMTPVGAIGTGVRVDDVQRVRERLIDTSYRRDSGLASSYDTRNQILGQLESVLGEPSDTGLSANLDAFWSAWDALASDPVAPTSKATVRQNAQNLVLSLNRASTQVDGVADSVRTRITQAVGQLNDLAKQVADLNHVIVTEEASGHVPDLLDKRDLLLDQMAQLGATRVLDNQYGSIQVVVDGETLVDGSSYRQLSTPTFPVVDGHITASVSIDGDQIAFGQGSQIGAMVTVINDDIYGSDGIASRLDDLAKGIVTKVNALHEQGWSEAGEALGGGVWTGTPTGSMVDFFDPASLTAGTIKLSAAVEADYNVIAAGYEKDAASANSLALDMAALRDDATTMSGGTQSFASQYRETVSGLGIKVASSGDSKAVYQTLADQEDNRRSSVSGVSIDEELINLTQHQQAYTAASKVITTVDEMLDTLLNL